MGIAEVSSMGSVPVPARRSRDSDTSDDGDLTMWGLPLIDIETTNALCTTGGHVWNAAHRLHEFLGAPGQASTLGLTRPGVRVLELGAGCGWLGLNIACNLPNDACVALTEQVHGGAMEHLLHNIQLSTSSESHGLPERVQGLGCDWTHYTDCWQSEPAKVEAAGCFGGGKDELPEWSGELLPKDGVWDFIIGSDLVYNDAGVSMLPRVIRTHMSPHSVMYYAHTRGRFEAYDIDFAANLEAQGLSVEEVREPGIPTPPPSPPPFTELYPELRIVVFKIRLATGDV